MTRPATLNLDLHHELIVDLFAGGGGMSTAIEQYRRTFDDCGVKRCGKD